MLSGDKRCKCNKAVTRHQSRAQDSYGHYYYKCYKAFKPGSCNFFAWEPLPSPPPSPDMAQTRRGGDLEPTTPSRSKGAPYIPAPAESPLRKRLIEHLEKSFEEEEEAAYATASSTPMITPRKRGAAPNSATGRPLFSESPTKSSPFSQSGERALVRAATEGDLGLSRQMSRDDLLKLLETKNEQLEAKEERIRALERELHAVRQENAIFGPELSPISLPPSPSKGKGKAPEFVLPMGRHEPTSESSIKSHFPRRSPINNIPSEFPVMWN